MVIISRGTINQYINDYPAAEEALKRWYLMADTADWGSINDIREQYNNVDYVKDNLYIFNIMGNHYRLIVRIIFKARTIYIRFFGTHVEYDKVNLNDL